MDNYIKLERIGKGSGDIKVYRVKDLRTGGIFALKKIPIDKKSSSNTNDKYLKSEVLQ